MKFNEGVWNARENVQVLNAVEVSQVATHLDDEGTSWKNRPDCEPHIRAVCTTRHIKHRGDLINKPTITVKVTSPSAGVFAVEARHFLGRSNMVEPSIPLYEDMNEEPARVEIKDETDYITLSSGPGKAAARVNKRPESFGIDFTNASGDTVTSFGKNSISWVLHKAASPQMASKENAATTIQDPYYRSPASTRQGYMAMSLSLEHNEKVYGFGERFGPFIKNGQIIESSNDDGGSSSDSGEHCNSHKHREQAHESSLQMRSVLPHEQKLWCLRRPDGPRLFRGHV